MSNNLYRQMVILVAILSIALMGSSPVLASTPPLPRVAVYGADEPSFLNDVITKLSATGAYSEVDNLSPIGCSNDSTPTLATLQQYEAVLVYSNCGFNDAVALGNVLADYVDSGGRVVISTFALFWSAGNPGLSGRFVEDGYLPVTQGTYTYGTRMFLIADLPDDPLLIGVNSFDGGSASYHNINLSITDGATLVAHWTDGSPLIAYKDGVVALNFFPPSSDATCCGDPNPRSEFWDSSTDGVQLLTNALSPKSIIDVSIDIKPGGDPNSINLRSEGIIPVAILTTPDFDASSVDRDSVRFGVTGTEASPVQSALSDVDHDDDLDAILHFAVMDTGLVVGDTTGYITGQTVNGELIEGSDSVNLIFNPAKKKPAVTDLGTLGGAYSYPYYINERGQVTGVSQTSSGDEHAFFWHNGVMSDLGTLGGSYSYPYAFNERGDVTGASVTASGEEHAFFWRNGVMTDLGTLGGGYSYPIAINDNGQVAGYSATLSGDEHAFFWQNGVMTDLGTLGGSYSFANRMNENGQIIGDSQLLSGELHAFLWQNGVMTDLGTLGGSYSWANVVNGNGQVIGGSQTNSGEEHAFLWQNSVMTDLGTLGGTFTSPYNLNEMGQVVGVSQTPSYEIHAFLWQNGQMTDLGTLGGGNSYPSIINDHGQVIGTSDVLPFGFHAFLWQDGVMTDLGTLGSTVSYPSMINERGQIIGFSYTVSYEGHSFLWQNGVMTDLTDLGMMYANGINDKGQIIGVTITASGDYHAALIKK